MHDIKTHCCKAVQPKSRAHGRGAGGPGVRIRASNPPGGAARIFSYVVRVDSGFAPNPFHGLCTLACCKPAIRRTAAVGDLVVGLSTGSASIVYAMRVTEILSFAEYWTDPRFRAKRPRRDGDREARRGDNIYRPLTRGAFRPLPSNHSKRDGTEDAAAMEHDLGGRHVLVSDDFVYFGAEAVALPRKLRFLRVGRAHRCRFSTAEMRVIETWFSAVDKGRRGLPAVWGRDRAGRS